jgi:hypothetical protein
MEYIYYNKVDFFYLQRVIYREVRLRLSKFYSFISSNKIYLCLLIILSVGLLILSMVIIYPYVPDGRDWAIFYRPAVIRLFTGASPYEFAIGTPPWTLLPLAPLALLPPRIGSTILVIASPVIFGLIAYKLGAKLLPVMFFAFSSPVIHNAFNINIEWLPALGLLMPPQIGLFFVLMKPQSGIGVAVYWFFEAWQKDRIKGVIKVFWPVTLALLISFALYGFGPIRAANMTLDLAHQAGDANLFPWAVPLGLGILFYSIRKKLQTLSISASPLLSPYVGMHSWSSFLLGLVNYPAFSISACIISWIITAWGWSQ